jgi:tetratricopeptide (TPR) repeat protein
MKRLLILSFSLCGSLAALAFAPQIGDAQGAPKAPPKRSFSNKPKPAGKHAAVPEKRQATQEELVDAVLGDTMNQLWDQADAHGHEGEYNHFINLSRVIVQGDPHNMEAFATSAYLLWSTSRWDDAEAMIKDGIAANPKSFYMYDEMGVYWFIERKNPKAAIPYYEQAVKFDCPWGTWNSLANCYEKTDQWEKAVGAWEKATLYRDNLVAIRRLKQARQKVAERKGGQ